MKITRETIVPLLKPRDTHAHKGMYGHALLVAGSHGKIGAAVLAAKACLRGGVGLLTVHLPACGYTVMQTSAPEAMVLVDGNAEVFSSYIDTAKYTAIGVGPGLGTDPLTQKALHHLLKQNQHPVVLDADALNILSLNKEWLDDVPENSILTPHPKEFERLSGQSGIEAQVAFSKRYKVFVVGKGAGTCISTPSGETYINTTGNPGMATGGSGDVLTGLLTALLAQGYGPLHTCMAGVFAHGLAGDLAKERYGEAGLVAGDQCEYVAYAFKSLTQ